MTSAAMNAASSGLYATARKGGLTPEEIREIEAHRERDRPTPWRVLAERYGRCEADIKALFEPVAQPTKAPASNDDKPLMTWEERLRRQRLTRRATFWTEEKDRMLKRMWVDQWMPASQCADILGCSEKSVSQRLATLGINQSMRKRVA